MQVVYVVIGISAFCSFIFCILCLAIRADQRLEDKAKSPSENDNVRLVVELLNRGEDWETTGINSRKTQYSHRAGVQLVIHKDVIDYCSLSIKDFPQKISNEDWLRIKHAAAQYSKGGGPPITQSLARSILDMYDSNTDVAVQHAKDIDRAQNISRLVD